MRKQQIVNVNTRLTWDGYEYVSFVEPTTGRELDGTYVRVSEDLAPYIAAASACGVQWDGTSLTGTLERN